jgi:hypothetical protein
MADRFTERASMVRRLRDEQVQGPSGHPGVSDLPSSGEVDVPFALRHMTIAGILIVTGYLLPGINLGLAVICSEMHVPHVDVEPMTELQLKVAESVVTITLIGQLIYVTARVAQQTALVAQQTVQTWREFRPAPAKARIDMREH